MGETTHFRETGGMGRAVRLEGMVIMMISVMLGMIMSVIMGMMVIMMSVLMVWPTLMLQG